MSDCRDNNDCEFEFDKEIEVEIENEISWDVCNDFYSGADVEYDVCVDVDIDSNVAFLTLDVEAVGEDTLVEVYANVLTCEDSLSHVSLTAMSAIE